MSINQLISELESMRFCTEDIIIILGLGDKIGLP